MRLCDLIDFKGRIVIPKMWPTRPLTALYLSGGSFRRDSTPPRRKIKHRVTFSCRGTETHNDDHHNDKDRTVVVAPLCWQLRGQANWLKYFKQPTSRNTERQHLNLEVHWDRLPGARLCPVFEWMLLDIFCKTTNCLQTIKIFYGRVSSECPTVEVQQYLCTLVCNLYSQVWCCFKGS